MGTGGRGGGGPKSPIVQGKATWPRDVHTGPEERRYDLSLNEGLFDDAIDFVSGDAAVPNRLSCRSVNLNGKEKGWQIVSDARVRIRSGV